MPQRASQRKLGNKPVIFETFQITKGVAVSAQGSANGPVSCTRSTCLQHKACAVYTQHILAAHGLCRVHAAQPCSTWPVLCTRSTYLQHKACVVYTQHILAAQGLSCTRSTYLQHKAVQTALCHVHAAHTCQAPFVKPPHMIVRRRLVFSNHSSYSHTHTHYYISVQARKVVCAMPLLPNSLAHLACVVHAWKRRRQMYIHTHHVTTHTHTHTHTPRDNTHIHTHTLTEAPCGSGNV